MANLTNLWNTILTQRTWSWALIGIGYLLVFLLVRSLFLHSLVRRARALNSKWYHEIKKVYMKKCIAGSILLLGSILILILFCQTANLKQASLYEVGIVFLIILTVLFAIMSHLIAFGTSVIHVLKQIENNQMTL